VDIFFVTVWLLLLGKSHFLLSFSLSVPKHRIDGLLNGPLVLFLVWLLKIQPFKARDKFIMKGRN